ncbi:MAG TPA: T9SS type A sorting domain-containing protein, partial [Saprospiraceae bacterium]|nr:T9SS type A sorting domain-containing protein [Saprospiraceae bacterium]
LTHLKTNYETFNTTDFQLNTGGFLKSIRLNHPEMNVVVLGNFAVTNGQISAPFPAAGVWYEYFSGDSLNVSATPTMLPLAAGEYRLYTSVKLPPPPFGTITKSVEVVRDYFKLSVAPNPSNGDAIIYYTLPESADVRVEVFNMLGQRLQVRADVRQPAGQHTQPIGLLEPGMYIIKLTAGNKIETQQLSVVR